MTTIPSWQSCAVLVAIVAISWLVAYRLWHHVVTAETGRWPSLGSLRIRRLHIASLCVLALAMLTSAMLLGLLDAFDVGVRAWVPVLYDSAFVHLCVFITSLGNTETLIAVTAVAVGLLWALGQRREVAGLVCSAVGAELTTFILKYAIGRSRPAFEAFASASTPSFPSAHAGGAVAIYGFVTIAIACRLAQRARFEAAFWGTSFIVFLAATRIIIGVHYFSDVIAGLLVGTFWLVTGRAVAESNR